MRRHLRRESPIYRLTSDKSGRCWRFLTPADRSIGETRQGIRLLSTIVDRSSMSDAPERAR
jgi:hypothetical protein